MTLIIQMLLLAVGFLMLVKGADWFVDGSSAVARRFGIPQLVIGTTVFRNLTNDKRLFSVCFFQIVG